MTDTSQHRSAQELSQASGSVWKYLIPLVIFVLLAVLLWAGLDRPGKRGAREDVPTPLIGKPAPVFRLPLLHEPDQIFSPEQMKGKVWLLNVWASWCVSCREEHPVLMQFSRLGEAPLYGLNYKDERSNGTAWLRRFGDPYVLSAFDYDGRVGIDFGVYGVPETYVIDKEGIIRYKHTGPVSMRDINEKILPLIRELQQ